MRNEKKKIVILLYFHNQMNKYIISKLNQFSFKSLKLKSVFSFFLLIWLLTQKW